MSEITVADEESPDDLRKAYELLFAENGKLRVMLDAARVTLRDRFAGQAMQAMVSDAKRGPDTLYMNYDVAAREAYAIANAMIEARKS